MHPQKGQHYSKQTLRKDHIIVEATQNSIRVW